MKSLHEQLIINDESLASDKTNEIYKNEKICNEKERFTKYSSLLTILYMAIGPLSFFVQ